MYYIILFITLLIIINLYFIIAEYFNIIDKPNNRSSHSKITIRGGGIIFTIGAIVYFISTGLPFPWFILGLVMISIISFIDDIKTVSRGIRFAVHVVAVILLFYQLYYNYFNFYNNFIPTGFFGMDLFDHSLYNHVVPTGLFGILFIISLIVAVGIINAYNFMDGINGITGGYSLAVLAGLWMANNYDTMFVDNRFIYSIAIALMVFNLYNFRHKARCFAGDIGSVTIAFILIFLLGMLIERSGNIFYLFFFTLYGVDSVLTIIHRIYLKENIFEAHRKHFFQILANEAGISHVKISIGYTVIQTVINLILVIFAARLSIPYLILIGLGLLIVLTAIYMIVKRKYNTLDVNL